MAISNEWVNVNGMVSVTESDTTEQKTITYWDGSSVEKIASAIGWETINLPANVTLKLQNYSASSDVYEYDSTTVRLMRPIDDTSYDYAVIPYLTTSQYSNSRGMYIVNVNTGVAIGWIYISSNPANYVMVLRPFAQGSLVIRYHNASSSIMRYVIIDKFLNPKTNAIRWGVLSTSIYASGVSASKEFADLSSGLIIDDIVSDRYIDMTMTYVALKKMTAISADGIFVAQTIFMAYIDYSTTEKTIELEGDQYRCIPVSTRYSRYIPLA